MVLHFLILSGEEEDFVREILIDAESTFLDFHKAIQESVGYDAGQLASFFTADDDWVKGEEITLMQMDESSDSRLMDEVKLKEYVDDAKDKLIYTFDFFGNRGFFVEVLSVSGERALDKAAVVRAEGDAPAQVDVSIFGGDQEEEDLFSFEEEDDLMDGIEEVGLDELGEEW